MNLRAPAKLNLCLYLGPPRDDGLHELLSLVLPIDLWDELRVSEVSGGEDEVVTPRLEQPDLTARALVELRRRGWERPPLRIELEKRIPVAAGLGGGSADAAAVLRLAQGEVEGLEDIARHLGADVPAQLDPRFALVGGAGERVESFPEPAELGVALIPRREGLSTAEVYAEADSLGLGRDHDELDRIASELRGAAPAGSSPLEYSHLLRNDLQQAALSLRPEIAEALRALEEAGAAVALLTGSGPTVFGLFSSRRDAEKAAEGLSSRYRGAVAAAPLTGTPAAGGSA